MVHPIPFAMPLGKLESHCRGDRCHCEGRDWDKGTWLLQTTIKTTFGQGCVSPGVVFVPLPSFIGVVGVLPSFACFLSPFSILFPTDPDILNGVYMSEALNPIFVDNFERDPTLTWQYFGSSTGFFRLYPGKRAEIGSALPVQSNSLAGQGLCCGRAQTKKFSGSVSP